MSAFGDQMESANEMLLEQTGDSIEYWPAGVEADAVDIDAIWTGLGEQVEQREHGAEVVRRAEVQIWADDTRGIETVNVKGDKIVRVGETWTVVAVLETVAGMHRLHAELGNRDVVGRSRGRR